MFFDALDTLIIPIVGNVPNCAERGGQLADDIARFIYELVGSANLMFLSSVQCNSDLNDIDSFANITFSDRVSPRLINAIVEHFRRSGLVFIGNMLLHGAATKSLPVMVDVCTIFLCPADCTGSCGWDLNPVSGNGTCRTGRTTSLDDLAQIPVECSTSPTTFQSTTTSPSTFLVPTTSDHKIETSTSDTTRTVYTPSTFAKSTTITSYRESTAEMEIQVLAGEGQDDGKSVSGTSAWVVVGLTLGFLIMCGLLLALYIRKKRQNRQMELPDNGLTDVSSATYSPVMEVHRGLGTEDTEFGVILPVSSDRWLPQGPDTRGSGSWYRDVVPRAMSSPSFSLVDEQLATPNLNQQPAVMFSKRLQSTGALDMDVEPVPQSHIYV